MRLWRIVDGLAGTRRTQMLRKCHSRGQYAAVLTTFETVNEEIVRRSSRFFAGAEVRFYKESRNASVHPTLRRHRVRTGHVPRLHWPAAHVRARRRAALEHGEDRLHLRMRGLRSSSPSHGQEATLTLTVVKVVAEAGRPR